MSCIMHAKNDQPSATHPYVVVGADVSVDGARRSVTKRQEEDVNVEHPVEVGEHLRSVLQKRNTSGVSN